MKFFRKIIKRPDPEKQAAWDRYSRLGGMRPGDTKEKGNNFLVTQAKPKDRIGPSPVVKMTNQRPAGGYRRWTPPGRTPSN